MKKITLEVKNKLGLHARPASMLVREALNYDAEVNVENMDGVCVSGKSIMGLMTLAASQGTKLNIIVDGKDEEILIKSFRKLFESNFEEH